MGYQGSTELSSIANPPRCLGGANMWGKRSTTVLSSSKVVGQNVWLYNTTDGSTELISTAYFIDGLKLGMRPGDLIFGSIDTGTTVTMYGGVIGPVTTAGCGINSTNAYISSTR